MSGAGLDRLRDEQAVRRIASSPLFFEAGAGAVAIGSAHLPVIRADFRHRAIAPAMADIPKFLNRCAKHLVLLRRDIHFFGAKVFAEIRVHNQAMSWARVRCTSARTIGTLYPLCACTWAFSKIKSAALAAVASSRVLPSRKSFAAFD